MKEDLEEILFTSEQIQARLEVLAKLISADFKGKNPGEDDPGMLCTSVDSLFSPGRSVLV